MEVTDTAAAATVRAEVRGFLDELLPAGWRGAGAMADEELRDFRATLRIALNERGWLAPTWPRALGGAEMTHQEQLALAEEFMARRVPLRSEADATGISLLGNTMLRWSDAALLQRFLPRMLSGEDIWCQGFSEPGAGSDLAAITTRAELHGDQWVINGQKVWSSLAHESNWMFLLARTSSSHSRHRGLSMLLVPMGQPGVEVRPIRNMAGADDFNEVFLTDARTDAELVVGGVDNGWSVAMTLLGFERGESAMFVPAQFREELDRLVDLARGRGLLEDQGIRRRLAWCHVEVEKLRCFGLRTVAELSAGRELGPEAASFKLSYTEYHRRASELAMDVLGTEALTLQGRRSRNAFRGDDPGTPSTSGSWGSVYLTARAGTIYAGTSQVQRNIIGEMLLGLPKETSAARGA